MNVEIKTMSMRHYDAVLSLWSSSPGVFVQMPSDSRASIGRYLRRNRGLSLVALHGRKIVGALLVGHDGRRGLLHHLAVDSSHRRQGVARQMVDEATARLKAVGVGKIWIVALASNAAGREFWKSMGWNEYAESIIAGKELR